MKDKYSQFNYEDLAVKLRKGKFSEYTYKSPYWGYKKGYKWNQVIYIYLTGAEDKGWIEVHHFKNANRLEIIDYLKNFRETSRNYRRAINCLKEWGVK